VHLVGFYLLLLLMYVQSWTPDDGRKDRPKNVEWYSINSKIVRIVDFTIEIYHYARSNESQKYSTLLYSSWNTFIKKKKKVLFNDVIIRYDCISGFYMKEVWLRSNGRMILTEANRSTVRKFPAIVTLTTKHPKSTFTLKQNLRVASGRNRLFFSPAFSFLNSSTWRRRHVLCTRRQSTLTFNLLFSRHCC
jgi:hypothetical protein